MRRVALAALLAPLAALAAAPSSAPHRTAAAPVNVTSIEPRDAQGAVVVERLAAPSATGAETWRLNLDLVLENALHSSPVVLNLVRISYPGGPSAKTVAYRQTIGAQDEYELKVPEDRDHPFPVPSSVVVELRFRGYDTKVVTRDLVEHRNAPAGGAYLFPGRREDLPDGWYWTDGQNHVRGTDHRNVAHQRFAYDFAVRRWDGTKWTNLKEGTSGAANEDFLIFGLPLYAAASGTVIKCRRSFPENVPGTEGASGNGLWIRVEGSQEHYFYAHMKRNTIPLRLCPRQDTAISVPVRAGRYVGRVGNSGSSSAPHLHVEAYVNDANGNASGRPMHFQRIRVREVAEDWSGSPPCSGASSGFADVRAAAVDRRMLVEPLRQSGNHEIGRHGLSDACFQDFFEGAAAAGYRLSWLSGFDSGGKTYLNAIFHPGGGSWTARFGLTKAAFQDEVEKAVAAGYRPTHVESYLRGGAPRYAFVATRGARRGTYRVYHGVTTAQHDRLVEQLRRRGLVPTNVSVVAPGGKPEYTALWEQRDAGAWELRSTIPVSGYQSWLEERARAGKRLVYLDAWVSNGKPMLSAIVSSRASSSYVARHDLSSQAYQSEYEKAVARGRRTHAVTAYPAGGAVRYAALWR